MPKKTTTMQTPFVGIARELLSKLRRLSAFTGHGASIGATHEEFVREAIRPLLSRRFSLKTGFVYVSEEMVSPQGDIIIVDESDPAPYFFQLGELVVVHPRAVAMVIDYKLAELKEVRRRVALVDDDDVALR